MTHHKYTELDLDKSVTVRFLTITKNQLILYFKFYDSNQAEVDVTNMQFVFTVTDVGKTNNLLEIVNNQFTRPETNSVKHVINSLNIVADTYKVDFTVTYQDSRVQTLMDGEFVVRDRYIV